jgi:hypothetical protein
MPGLPKAKIEIPLGLGIQTDVDDKLLPAGKVVKLTNAVWTRDGEILKRSGSGPLGIQYAAGTPGTMPGAWQLATHKGALVTLSKAGPRPLGVWSPQLAKWMAPSASSAADNINGVQSKLHGQVLPRRGTVYRSNALGGTSNVVSFSDIASNGTYALVGWTETNSSASTANSKASIIEIATGKTLFSFNQSGTFNSTSTRCVYHPGNAEFYLVVINGVNVNLYVWTVANLNAGTGSASAPFTLVSDATNVFMDAIINGTDLMIIYNGATTRIIRRSNVGTVTASNLTKSGGGAIATGVHCWMSDLGSAAKLAAVTTSVTDGVLVQWDINAGTGATTTTYTIDAAGGVASNVIGHTAASTSTGDFVVLWNGTAIKFGRRTGGSITTGTWILSARVASKSFAFNGDFYCTTTYLSDAQGTYFLNRVPTNFAAGGGVGVDETKAPSAKFAQGEAYNLGACVPSSIYNLNSSQIMTSEIIKVSLVGTLAAPQFTNGVDTITYSFNPTNVNRPVEFTDNLFVCGGQLGAFDGRTFAEEGFHLYPELPSGATQAGGSLNVNSVYEWIAVYRYTDDFGRIRRSQASLARQLTLSATDHGAQITVNTLKLHGRPINLGLAIATGVVIELYRSPANTSASHFLAAVVANREDLDTITITDTAADTSLGPQLYSDGDVLQFQSPPPALATATYKDRLALISADDPTLIWISLPLSETEGPRFNEVSTIRIDDSHGDLVGLAAVDDRLVAFKSDAIYTIVGDGPDLDGNGTFGIAQIIASGIGCSEPRSIIEIPDGVMFRSSSTRAGIFMINRGLSVEYVGKDVQDFITGNNSSILVADAIHLPQLIRTIYFLNSNGGGAGVSLIYDHTLKLWSTNTGQYVTAATDWNGHYAFQSFTSSNLLVVVEDDNRFDDNGSDVQEYAETPWLALAQIKGFEKFRKLQILGDTRIINDASDPGYTVRLDMYANYETTPFQSQSKLMAVTSDINLTELKFPRKLTAIKVGINISKDPGGSNSFAGPKLSALVIEYSTKEGLRKTAYTNRTT